MKKGKHNRHALEDRINAHAWKSPDFKKRLLANPFAALSELIEEPIPNDYTIRVIEEGKKEFVIVLHPMPSSATTQLNEEDLRNIAAAKGSNLPWPNC